VQSAFTYAGATDCATFRDTVVVGVQSSAGFYEGKPHGAIVGKPPA
jgi:hypothetical protein